MYHGVKMCKSQTELQGFVVFFGVKVESNKSSFQSLT